MTTLRTVLSAMIRNGKVIVETPNLDLDELRRAVQNDSEMTLEEIEEVVYDEHMTDAEKVEWIRKRMRY